MSQYNKESIKDIFYPKVNALTYNHLESSGFKHLKSKNEYKRIKSEFRQIISISGYSAKIETINNKPSLCFKIVSVIELPEYIKWLKKNYTDKLPYRCILENANLYLNLNEIELDSIQQYKITDSQKFKELVSSKISGSGEIKYIDYSNNTNGILNAFIEKLNNCSNGQFLYSNRINDYNIADLLLPIYFGLKDVSHLPLQNKISSWKESIEKAEQKNPIAIQNLNKLINLTNEHFELSIHYTKY